MKEEETCREQSVTKTVKYAVNGVRGATQEKTDSQQLGDEVSN